MDRTLVVVLKGQSLFAEGTACRLKEFPGQVDLQIMDPKDPEVIDRITALKPAAIILDTTDEETIDLCPLVKLFLEIGELKIIQLDSQNKQLQVLSSAQKPATEFQDLLHVITTPLSEKIEGSQG